MVGHERKCLDFTKVFQSFLSYRIIPNSIFSLFLLFTLSFLFKDSLKECLNERFEVSVLSHYYLKKQNKKKVFLPIRVLDMPPPFSPLCYSILFSFTVPLCQDSRRVSNKHFENWDTDFYFFLLDFPWKEKTYEKWFWKRTFIRLEMTICVSLTLIYDYYSFPNHETNKL